MRSFIQIVENPVMVQPTMYHGTSSEKAAKKIMKDGYLVGRDTQERTHLAPVKGRVYMTPDLSYAIIYAIGGAMLGHDLPERMMESRYGYVFVIRGDDLGSVQPDEDSVGEFLSQNSMRDPKRPWAFIPKPELAGEKRTVFDYIFRSMTENQRRGACDGFISAQAQGGKRALKGMPRWMMDRLIEWGAHVAHDGPAKPTECWRIDKKRCRELAKDGSNFFEIATQVPLSKERVTESQGSRHKGSSLYSQGKSVVTIYRACEGSVETFNPMDYVTLSRKFAIEHAEHMAAVEDKPYVVISKVVSGMDVYDAYNPGEYFYDGPQIKARVIARSNPVLDEGYRKFPEYPENRLAPSDSHHRTGRSRGEGLRGPHESKELGLMLAGKKPAAMLPLEKELPDAWKKAAEQNGWAYRHIGDAVMDHGSIVVALPGEEYRIDRLDKIYANARRQGYMTRADHIKIGRLLGYTKDEIKAFIYHRYGGQNPAMHVK